MFQQMLQKLIMAQKLLEKWAQMSSKIGCKKQTQNVVVKMDEKMGQNGDRKNEGKKDKQIGWKK